MSNVIKSAVKQIGCSDKILWAIIIAISAYCLVLMKSVSNTGTDFFTTQFIAISVGYVIAFIIQFVDYRKIANQWKWIALVGVALIVYTIFFGIAVEGTSGVNARAWIKIPSGLTFQPSELVKIGFMVTFSKHLAMIKERREKFKFKDIVALIFHAIVPVALTHMQGDDGAAIIFLCMAICMAFIAGVQLRYFIIAFVLCVFSLPIIWNFVLADYQKLRLINQINPEADPLNMGFQQIQGKLSIASGGLTGKGLFNGPRVANGIVPVQESDFIFSVAGEELGFLGCFMIIFLLFALIWRVIHLGSNSKDYLGCFMCFGFFGLIASQMIFNLGMCLSMLPVMGVTLPFFSAGGSSTICLYIGIGLIQSVNIAQSYK